LATVIDLAPSILSANFAQLGAQAKAALEGGGTVLHLDVMDGHFVPNLTIGPPVVASLRKTIPDVTFDCHLMIENPDQFIPAFAEAGANWISVHQEACIHLDRTLHLIESHNCEPGVVINPATPVHMLDEVLEIVHHVLIMSVNPGFGAQHFIPNSLKNSCGRQRRVFAWRHSRKCPQTAGCGARGDGKSSQTAYRQRLTVRVPGRMRQNRRTDAAAMGNACLRAATVPHNSTSNHHPRRTLFR
jgi:ribulose-phosphate 3-epimerase